MVNELATKRSQAFSGATSIPYPVLEGDYIEFLLARLAAGGASNLPTYDVALAAFRTLGNRPEEIVKALRQLQLHLPARENPDVHLPVIAATLRSAAADIELAKVEQLGSLAIAIFERIAAADGNAKGVSSAEAAADYSRILGREVKIDEIQPLLNELVGANLIMRRAHGLYGIADPFVQETWRERNAMLNPRTPST